jgi:hypothetical protein
VAAEREKLSRDRQQWKAECAQIEAQINEKSKSLEARSAEIDARRESLDCQRQAWEGERRSLEEQLAGRVRELETQHAEVDRLGAELERQRRELESESAAVRQTCDQENRQLDAGRTELRNRQTELERREREIESRQAELESLRADLDARKAELDARQADPESGAAEVPAVPEPAEAADEVAIRRRFVRVTPRAEEEPSQREPAAAAADEAEEVPERQEPVAAAVNEAEEVPERQEPASHEESIAQYMSRLMQRMGKGSGDSRATPPAAPRAAATPSRQPAFPTAMAKKPASARHEPVKMVARSPVPEKGFDLKAMRELANSSARHAIDHHAHQRWVTMIRKQAAIAVSAMLLGIFLIAIWWRLRLSVHVFYVGLTSLLLSALWAVQYVALPEQSRLKAFMQRIGLREKNSSPSPAEATPDEPQPEAKD